MRQACGWAASLALVGCAGAADAEPQWLPAPLAASAAPATAPVRPSVAHLRPSDHLGNLLDHPALSGFARLLLPRSDVEADRRTRLNEVASLLPYHTQVDAADVVAGL